MSIQDVSKVTQQPGEPVYANGVEAEMARLSAGRARALKQDDKTLIEFYDKKISHLKSVDRLQKTSVPKKSKKKKSGRDRKK